MRPPQNAGEDMAWRPLVALDQPASMRPPQNAGEDLHTRAGRSTRKGLQ